MKECLICDLECKKERSLKYHLIKTHKIAYEKYCKIFHLEIDKLYCKICKREIDQTKTHGKIYCSKECKFNDFELNSKRVRKEKNDPNKISCCKICKKTFKDQINVSGSLTKHLSNDHKIHEKDFLLYYDIVERVAKEKFHCPYCNWTSNDLTNSSGWFTVHLRKVHNMSPEEHVHKYPKHKILWKIYFENVERDNFLKSSENNRIKCKICNKYFKKLSNTHLKSHKITIEEYKKKYNTFTLVSDSTSKKQSQIILEYNSKYGCAINRKKEKTSLEKKFEQLLIKFNIDYSYHYNVGGKEFDFYLPKYNVLIETDGEGAHKEKLENLTFMQLNSSMNDYKKTRMILNDNTFKLIRLQGEKCNNLDTFDEHGFIETISKLNYLPNYDISYTQIIMNKEYLIRYKEVKGILSLEKYVSLLLNFIRTFQPVFPYPENDENINSIIYKIQKTNFSEIESNYVFSANKCSNIGISYLKSNFKSFWNSNFHNSISPVEAWENDKIMKKIIEYRIGINKSNEVFDFSLKNLVKGLSSRRFTISFFKPVLAASIYKYFLGDIKNPIVIDPCAGFGGRMLGFKSLYPNGTYIGIEPNKRIFDELVILSKSFDNVFLYNCKLENYSGDKKCNLTFTSVPYYNSEIYNDREIQTKEHWIKMIKYLILNFNNVLINISEKSFDEFQFSYIEKYFISLRCSHFSKNRQKSELLLKLF